MKRSTVRLLLLIVTIIWGSGYVVSEILLQTISPFQLLTGRFGITSLVLLLVFHKKLKEIKKTVLIKGMFMGCLLYMAFVLQTVGLFYTTPSKNAFLTQVSVVLVPILSFMLFKQKASVKTQIGILVTLIGVALMSLDGFGAVNLGDVLSLMCALFFAMQVILMGRFVREEDPVLLMIVQMSSAAVIGISVNLVQGNLYLGGIPSVDISLLYLALFSTLFSFGVQTMSQKHVTPSEISLVLSLESFWGMMFSILILKEAVSVREVIGAWMILSGVVASQVPLNPRTWKVQLQRRKSQTKELVEVEKL